MIYIPRIEAWEVGGILADYSGNLPLPHVLQQALFARVFRLTEDTLYLTNGHGVESPMGADGYLIREAGGVWHVMNSPAFEERYAPLKENHLV